MKFVFRKFPSIENIENVRNDLNPELIAFLERDQSRDNWIATEKIDGANIGLYISTKDWAIASRNQFIGDAADLNDVLSAAEDQLNVLIFGIQKVLSDDEYMILYGEYFGAGIQNRIYYGTGKYFKFFHAAIVTEDSAYDIPWIGFEKSMKLLGFGDFIVPEVGRFKTFAEAIKCKNDSVSALTDAEHNSISEGIVIRPIYGVGFSPNSNEQLVVKSKNEKFKEQGKAIQKAPMSSAVQGLRDEFLSYISVNRMYSVFSKLGNPKAQKEIGKYLAAFKDDAIEDFTKDHRAAVSELSDDEKDYVFGLKSQGFLIFKQVCREMDLKL